MLFRSDKDLTVNINQNFGNTFRPLIEQDGNFYAAAIAGPTLLAGGTTGGTTGYNTISNPTLLAADFLQIDPATGAFGTANPNFAGDPMLFGIAQLLASSTLTGTSAIVDFDNLNITLTNAPEPGTLALFGAGLVCLGLTWRRKHHAASAPAGGSACPTYAR